MKVLFICNQNENRSKTAEELFKDRFETKSAGLYNEKPVTKKQIEWADMIIVMEDAQRKELAKRFPDLYMQKKIVSLDIPDAYSYGQESLKMVLKSRIMEQDFAVQAIEKFKASAKTNIDDKQLHQIRKMAAKKYADKFGIELN